MRRRRQCRSVRLMMVETIRKSIHPEREHIGHRRQPMPQRARKLHLTHCAGMADVLHRRHFRGHRITIGTPPLTLSQGTGSPDNNSATAANRYVIAVDSSRVATPITSMRSQSAASSHVRPMIYMTPLPQTFWQRRKLWIAPSRGPKVAVRVGANASGSRTSRAVRGRRRRSFRRRARGQPPGTAS